MPPMQNRPRSLFGPKSQSGLGLFPSRVHAPAEELPTTPLPATNIDLEQKETALLPAQLTPIPPALTRQLSRPGITRQLSNPGITRTLTGTLNDDTEGGAPRTPVLIKGEMKKHVPEPISPHSHKKRRLLVSISGVLILVVVTAFAMLAVSPLGHDIGVNLASQPVTNSLITNSNSNPDLMAQATATAVSYQQNDGYGGGGAMIVGNGAGSLNWPTGQCTYWANYRYHQLTGYWVPWSGNADQWVAGARAAGWNVSTSPHVPSIAVLMAYVQGAWGYGHVAVVESVNDTTTPETVYTSNMNWWVNGGGWNKVSYADFTVGTGGIYFVWHS